MSRTSLSPGASVFDSFFEQTAEGIQMFAVCSKKESKTDAPGLKEVRDKMFEKKFGAKANRYLADLRRQAMIEYK